MAIILRCLTERSELIDWFVPGRTGARAVDSQTRLEPELAISHFNWIHRRLRNFLNFVMRHSVLFRKARSPWSCLCGTMRMCWLARSVGGSSVGHRVIGL